MVSKLGAIIRELGVGGLLFVVGLIMCIVAAYGGFRLQQPDPHNTPVEFSWSTGTCWLRPCPIDCPFFAPWERNSIALAKAGGLLHTAIAADMTDFFAVNVYPDREERRSLPLKSYPFPNVTAIAVGPQGTVVVSDCRGGVHHLELDLRDPVGYQDYQLLSNGHWTTLPSITDAGAAAISAVAVGPDKMLVVGDIEGSVYRWTNSNWQIVHEHAGSVGVSFVAVSRSGSIVVTYGSEAVYRLVPTGDTYDPQPLSVVGTITALAVGDGKIVIAEPSGRVLLWNDTSWNLLADSEIQVTAIAVGDGPIVISNKDGLLYEFTGRNFEYLQPRFRVSISSAYGWVTSALWTWILSLWIIVALTLSVQVIPPAWRRARSYIQSRVLESDEPVTDPQYATEEMNVVATRIFRFLCNADASAPLTIAVTGRWGSGKSSLMRHLARDLSEAHRPCVWFNAWHHQNETHLFAALMESIRRDGVPRSVLGRIEFHLSLGWVRLRHTPVWVISFILISTFFLVVVPLLASQLPLLKNLPNNLDTLASFSVPTIFLLWALRSRKNPLKAFGVKPSMLLRQAVNTFQITRFSDAIGFRHRFKQAFGEVCEAFRDRRLVIIIDDLDRCRPAQIAEVLEALNFLTTSGSCFIVIGIDEDQIRRAVGQYYKDVADEEARERQYKSRLESGHVKHPKAGDITIELSESVAFEGRQRYSEQYLEKLINLYVRVPIVEERHLDSLRGKHDQ